MAAGKEQFGVVGQRFGRLLATGYNADVSKRLGRDCYDCVCGCNNKIVTLGNSLRSGKTKSCGCLRKQVTSDRGSKLTGTNNPMYVTGKQQGWHTKEQYDFHSAIRKRDNFTCQVCNRPQDNHQQLTVHHKDEDHFNNTDENAVTLCKSCHMRVHRSHHNGERRKMEKAKRDQQDLDIMYAVTEQEQLGSFNDLII